MSEQTPLRQSGDCPACGHPRALHTLGPPSPPQTKRHLGATEDRPGACLVQGVGRVEHRPTTAQSESRERTPQQVEAAAQAWDEIEDVVDGFDRFGDGAEPDEDDLITIGRVAWDVHCRDQGYRS